jgi:hypothetical protein
MRFLADENFPRLAVSKLAEAGHDVLWIGAVSPGISDRSVVEIARRELRIILTFDKDFGELARSAGLPSSCGVIFFRVPLHAPASAAAEQLSRHIGTRDDWAGCFSVIEPGRVRMRRLD